MALPKAFPLTLPTFRKNNNESIIINSNFNLLEVMRFLIKSNLEGLVENFLHEY
jgi:hypothetical protein